VARYVPIPRPARAGASLRSAAGAANLGMPIGAELRCFGPTTLNVARGRVGTTNLAPPAGLAADLTGSGAGHVAGRGSLASYRALVPDRSPATVTHVLASYEGVATDGDVALAGALAQAAAVVASGQGARLVLVGAVERAAGRRGGAVVRAGRASGAEAGKLARRAPGRRAAVRQGKSDDEQDRGGELHWRMLHACANDRARGRAGVGSHHDRTAAGREASADEERDGAHHRGAELLATVEMPGGVPRWVQSAALKLRVRCVR
jgi:hypothetical protein